MHFPDYVPFHVLQSWAEVKGVSVEELVHQLRPKWMNRLEEYHNNLKEMNDE